MGDQSGQFTAWVDGIVLIFAFIKRLIILARGVKKLSLTGRMPIISLDIAFFWEIPFSL